jgi:prepilin peptidase CpaA
MTPIPNFLQLLLLALVLIAAVFDFLYRRIPNWLVLTGFIAGVTLRIVLGGWQGLGEAAGGFAFAFAVYLIFYALRAMGAGDVKLMAAVGAIAGPVNWFSIFILTSITGGLLAVILLLTRGGLHRAMKNVVVIVGELAQGRAPHRAEPALDVANRSAVTLPHGITIALGTCLFLGLLYLQPAR